MRRQTLVATALLLLMPLAALLVAEPAAAQDEVCVLDHMEIPRYYCVGTYPCSQSTCTQYCAGWYDDYGRTWDGACVINMFETSN